jgi:hypothetical protein
MIMKKFLIYSAVFALLFCSNFAMAQTSPPNNGPGGVSSRTPGSNLGLWLKGSEIVADQNGKLTITMFLERIITLSLLALVTKSP